MGDLYFFKGNLWSCREDMAGITHNKSLHHFGNRSRPMRARHLTLNEEQSVSLPAGSSSVAFCAGYPTQTF